MSEKMPEIDDFLDIYNREKVGEELVRKGINNLEKELTVHLQESLKNASKEGALPNGVGEYLGARLTAVCGYFSPDHAKADILAASYQNIFRNASMAVYILAAAAVLIVSGQYIFFHSYHGIIGLEIATIAVILFIIHYGNHVGWHRRWLDYRSLAERLRAGIFVSFRPRPRRISSRAKG